MPLQSKSGFTANDFEKIWSKTEAKNLQGSGKEFIKAENKTGINALILASIVIHESDWGNSNLAINNNNFFGWSAYDKDPSRYAKSFESRKECIYHVANKIKQIYLNPNGNIYTRNLKEMNIYYATDPEWDEKVADVLKKVIKIKYNHRGNLDWK